jgi:hypothetical protein
MLHIGVGSLASPAATASGQTHDLFAVLPFARHDLVRDLVPALVDGEVAEHGSGSLARPATPAAFWSRGHRSAGLHLLRAGIGVVSCRLLPNRVDQRSATPL